MLDRSNMLIDLFQLGTPLLALYLFASAPDAPVTGWPWLDFADAFRRESVPVVNLPLLPLPEAKHV